MEILNAPIRKNLRILALGAESAGVFAIYRNYGIFVSENFGDLLNENNFLNYKKAVLSFLKKEKIKPDVILTDLHPLYNSSIFGKELVNKFKASHIKVQHHIAHIFSAVGDKIINNTKYLIPDTFAGIAMDGTGYGLDGNIWGGEVFGFYLNNKKRCAERIGSLEEQIMIGGDMAIKEPARMLISILAKFLSKKDVYKHIKKYYSKNDFEMLFNQMLQNFNCQIVISAGRILDATAVLLGYAENERNFKHEAIKKLENNSGMPYIDIEPLIVYQGSREILNTTCLFEYLINNIEKDKRRLAATAQLYIAKGLYEIIKLQTKSRELKTVFAAGGLSNNKIISEYLEKQGVHMSKKIPRGDEGIVVGQIMFCLTNKGH